MDDASASTDKKDHLAELHATCSVMQISIECRHFCCMLP